MNVVVNSKVTSCTKRKRHYRNNVIFYEELVPDLCLTLASILDAHECVVQMLDEYPLNVTVSLQNIQVVKASNDLSAWVTIQLELQYTCNPLHFFLIIILYLFIYLNFQIYVCHNSLGYLRSDWFGWVKGAVCRNWPPVKATSLQTSSGQHIASVTAKC